LKKVLTAISQTPNGVLAMNSDIVDLVQTSNNLGVIITNKENNTITLSNFPRSSVAMEQTETINQLKSLAASINATIKINNEKPAWSYNPNSPLREKMVSTFKSMYGKPPTIRAVHAGLECGIFFFFLPSADFISIGPDVHGAHSPDERMSLSSYNRVYQYLVKFLEEL
jgi:dipeptidase D